MGRARWRCVILVTNLGGEQGIEDLTRLPLCRWLGMQATGKWFSSFLSLSSCLPALGTKASLICLHPKKELQGLLPRLGGELGLPHSDALLLKVLDLRGQAVVAGHLLTGDVGAAEWPASPSPRCPSTVYRFTLARERGILCSRLYFSSLLPLVLSESHLRAAF